ncbi:MAG: ribonuclease III [Clostridiales bacterium]|nr:ribonuclease III [Clostridiales bacterium]
MNKQLNTTALAYIGDAVYEVHVRNHVLQSGQANADKLHQMAVKYVKAEGQAKALKAIFDQLSEEEQDLVKRARNRKTTSKPNNANPVAYKLATALEALIGHLYLTGNTERLEEIIKLAMESSD